MPPDRGAAGVASSAKVTSDAMYWTHITERVVGDVVILDLQGQVTMSEESKPAAETVRRLVLAGQTRILLNLAHLPFIDSLGFHVKDFARGPRYRLQSAREKASDREDSPPERRLSASCP